MTKPPLHTRMIVSPSGPIHIGHVALAMVNRAAAVATGGTFIYGTRKVTCDLHPGKRDFPPIWAEKNMRELCSVLPPTPADELAAKGFGPSIGVVYGEDLEEAERVWHDCRFDEVWGQWPPDTPDDEKMSIYAADGKLELWNRQALTMGRYQGGHPHPFITLVRVLWEKKHGRNCLIRGADRQIEADLYNAIACRVRGDHDWVVQYFFPTILRSGEQIPQAVKEQWALSANHNRWNGFKISSSDQQGGNGFYLKDVLQAGRSTEELFAFLKWLMFPEDVSRDILETGWDAREGDPGVFPVMHNLRSPMVIMDATWFRFLKVGWARLF